MPWEQFGEHPMLFQHDNIHIHQVKSIKRSFSEFAQASFDLPTRALNYTSSKTTDKSDCKPGLIAI